MPGASTATGAAPGTQEREGDAAVADVIRNSMGTTGAREQVKEWLYDALETAGWTTALERTIINGERDKQRDKETKDSKDTPVAELVNSVAQKAFDSVPDTIRERLCRELLGQVREFQTNASPVDAADDTDVVMSDNVAPTTPSSRH